MTGPGDVAARSAERLHRLVLGVLLLFMGVELAALLWQGRLLPALIVAAIMGIVLAPELLRDLMPVRVPYVFQALVVAFVFASLFLGEVQRFYDRFPWWDSLLHFGSGLLLGTLGFMLLYILNANARVHLAISQGFMALFAFCFAMSLGALWEVFEFAMDELAGTRMQKPMLGDPSRLTDTMFDLILDALGAGLVALYGLYWMRRGERSFLTAWIDRVTHENPHLFERGMRMRGRTR